VGQDQLFEFGLGRLLDGVERYLAGRWLSSARSTAGSRRRRSPDLQRGTVRGAGSGRVQGTGSGFRQSPGENCP